MSSPHFPVLQNEVLQAFAGMPLHVYVDATLGAGGHAAAILNAHPEIDLFLGIDQDATALEIARLKLTSWPTVRLVKSNFSQLPNFLKENHLSHVNGILIDLGVSSMQLDQPERGFSFMREGPLDMRMNREQELTAAEIVNTWSEEDLGRIFREYGEEKRWRAAARAIIQARSKNKMVTTHDLAEALRTVLKPTKKGISPLTLAFQGLRIAVNDELSVLENLLPQAIEALAPGGRLAVISFHSLEDRIVKNAFRYAASDKENTSGIGGVFIDKEPTATLVTRKPIIAEEEEVKRNPRSRSAKLRILEKI